MIKSKTIFKLSSLFMTLGSVCAYFILAWWSYPLSQVSVPTIACKSLHRNDMPESCKQPLPIIKNADYTQINPSLTMIYSDLWWGSYSRWRDTAWWWSPGIDIATSAGTPVYAIWDGEVIVAWYAWGIWNSVTIRHTRNGQFIYSSYSHLSKILVVVWQKISEKDLIWEVWKTWTTIGAFWNHLDFQITTTEQKFYPYSYRDCREGTYHQIVDQWLCRESMAKNTLDPVKFLEFDWQIDLPNSSDFVQKIVVSSTDQKIDMLTDTYAYKITWLMQEDTAELWRPFSFGIDVQDLVDGRYIQWVLKEDITIDDTKWLLDFDRTRIQQIQAWSVKIIAVWKQVWSTILRVSVKGQTIWSFMLTITQTNVHNSPTIAQNSEARWSISLPVTVPKKIIAKIIPKKPIIAKKASAITKPARQLALAKKISTKTNLKARTKNIVKKPVVPGKVISFRPIDSKN